MKLLIKVIICLITGVLILSNTDTAEINATGKPSKNGLVLTIPASETIIIKTIKKVFDEVSIRSGIEISIQELPKKRALVEANRGNYDGVAMRVINLEKAYPNLRRIKVSIFAVQHVIFAKNKIIIESVHDFESLNEYVVKHNYTVGYLRGSKKARDELSRLPERSKKELRNPIQAFSMLESNRIDAYLAGPGIVSRAILKEQFNQSGIQEVGVFAEFLLFPYVHKKHMALIALLEENIQSMVDDGTLNNIQTSLK
jgi:polar amino acid transport system substrate-binding protein